MAKRQREVFLRTLLSDLLSQCPQWRVDDHCKIEWKGQPKNMWPEADLLIDTAKRRFIVEYDEDSDPSRSLTKYWPIIHQANKIPLTIIEIWERGSTIGLGYAEVTKWIAARLVELYPGFFYEFIERKDETARLIAKKVAQVIDAYS